jgi:hypothetical protein
MQNYDWEAGPDYIQLAEELYEAIQEGEQENVTEGLVDSAADSCSIGEISKDQDSHNSRLSEMYSRRCRR